jgi:hypothetical protein
MTNHGESFSRSSVRCGGRFSSLAIHSPSAKAESSTRDRLVEEQRNSKGMKRSDLLKECPKSLPVSCVQCSCDSLNEPDIRRRRLASSFYSVLNNFFSFSSLNAFFHVKVQRSRSIGLIFEMRARGERALEGRRRRLFESKP